MLTILLYVTDITQQFGWNQAWTPFCSTHELWAINHIYWQWQWHSSLVAWWLTSSSSWLSKNMYADWLDTGKSPQKELRLSSSIYHWWKHFTCQRASTIPLLYFSEKCWIDCTVHTNKLDHKGGVPTRILPDRFNTSKVYYYYSKSIILLEIKYASFWVRFSLQ